MFSIQSNVINTIECYQYNNLSLEINPDIYLDIRIIQSEPNDISLRSAEISQYRAMKLGFRRSVYNSKHCIHLPLEALEFRRKKPRIK